MDIAAPTNPWTTFNLFRFDRARHHIDRLKITGLVNITDLAAHAVMTGDKFLATALMAQLSTLPTRERKRAMLLRQELEGVIHDSDIIKAQDAISIARSRSRSVESRPLPEGLPD